MKFFIVLVSVFIFTSCTQQRMALRFADTAASWAADDYFDLTSSQKDNVKKQLKLFLNKAYNYNNSEISKIFDQADVLLAKADDLNKIDCREVQKITNKSRSLFSEFPQIGTESIQVLTQSLNDKQIQYFIEQVAQKNKEIEEKLKKSSEHEKRRMKRTIDNLNLLLGKLLPEQEVAIRSHIKENPSPLEEQFKNRKINFEKLKIAATTSEDFQRFVLGYVQNWRAYQSTIYLKQIDEQRLKNEQFYQNLICEASNKQLKHLRKKLAEIKKDFEEFFID